MPFCPKCGTEVEGRFCAKCGSPVAADAGATGGTTPPLPPPANPTRGELAPNVASALCYLVGVLTGILFLVIEPYNRNKTIRFHAFQAIFFWIAAVVAWIAVGIVSSLLGAISFVGFWSISRLLYDVVGLALFVIWIMLMYKAYNGERWVLPVIGPMAEKQA